MRRNEIHEAITCERMRQDQLKEQGRFPHTAADPELTNVDRFAIAGEEFGEVAAAVVQTSGLSTDRTSANLKKELIQLGAVVQAWLEAL